MPKAEDVTEKLLADTSGPGDHVARVKAAKAPKTMSPSLQATLDEWNRKSDKSLPHVSNVLAYGFRFIKPSQHSNLIRLIKGGKLRVCKVSAKPPEGSNAKGGSPYSESYYILRESCPTEVSEGQLHGRRRK
jgi:hypothetical protein